MYANTPEMPEQKLFDGSMNHLVDPLLKQEAQFNKQAAKYYHENWQSKYGNAHLQRLKLMQEWREYARGEQNINKYKRRLGVLSKTGAENKSYRNLDWSVLKVGPKFKRVVVGKIRNSMHGLEIKAIDPMSIDSERQYRIQLEDMVEHKSLYEEVQKITGHDMAEGILPEGAPSPINKDEIDLHMNMFYKDRYSMEMQDVITFNKEMNNWDQIEEEIVEDIVEVGFGGTRTWLDEQNNIRCRRVVPERTYSYGSKYNDFRDAEAVWEYVDFSFNELARELAKAGKTTEQIKELWTQALSDSSFAYNSYSDNAVPGDNLSSEAANKKKAVVMDLRFISIDTWVWQVGENQYGNPTISQKPLSWYNPAMGGEENGVIVKEIMQIYECKWLVGTECVWDYGVSRNLPIDMTNIAQTRLGYSLYRTGQTSYFSDIIPVLDQCQLNWLQYQNHVNKSKPQGVEIEMSAFSDISMTKGGEKMSPKQVLEMYYSTGNIVWRRKDWSGRDNGWKPISESAAHLPEGAKMHLELIMQMINFLRDISGLNEVVDGSTPRPDIGKTVSEMAAENSNNSLHYLYHAWGTIHLNTAKTMAELVPIQVQNGPVEGYISALGQNTMRFFKLNEDIGYRTFGIRILESPTPEQQQRIHKYVEIAISNGEISSEDGIMIEREINTNVYRAAEMFMMKRRQKAAEVQAAQKAAIQAESEAKMQEKQQELEFEAQKEERLAQISITKEAQLSQQRVIEEREKMKNLVILEKVKHKMDLTELEKEHYNKLLIGREKNRTEIEKATILADANIEANKARAMAKPAPSTKK